MHENNLKKEIKSIAQELISKGSDAGPRLRSLQSRVKNDLYEFKEEDKDKIFLFFFIHTVVDALYFNLTGDVPYDEGIHERINETFKSFGLALDQLSERMSDPKHCESYNAYVNIVNVYVEGLKQVREYSNEHSID